MEDDKYTGAMPDSKDTVDTVLSSNNVDTAAELARTKVALSAANKESADRRKKLEAYEKAEAEKQNADLSETQRLSKELEQLKASAESAQAKNRRYELERAISKAARAQNVEFSSDDALSDAIAVGAFGEIADDLSNADQVLKSVVKTKTHFFKQAEQEQKRGDINAGIRSRSISKSDIEQAEIERLRATGKY